jgi:hypothetical protein
VDTEGTAIVPVAGCLIAHDLFGPVLRALNAASFEVTGVAGDIDVRTGYPARHVHVHLGPGTEPFTSPLLRHLQNEGEDAATTTTIFWHEGRVLRCAPRANPPPLRFESPWAVWNLPPTAFYQVNPEPALRLAETARSWAALGAEDLAIDLYAGIGFFAAALAAGAKRVWALESHPAAVRAGEAALRRAGIENVRFVPGRVEDRLPTMNLKGRLVAALLDPPREGAPAVALAALDRLAPRRIVYVSCEPATLDRDLGRLPNYRHVRSVPYEFFPQTYHLESITLLERTSTG